MGAADSLPDYEEEVARYAARLAAALKHESERKPGSRPRLEPAPLPKAITLEGVEPAGGAVFESGDRYKAVTEQADVPASADQSGPQPSLLFSRDPLAGAAALAEIVRAQTSLGGHLAWAEAELRELPYDPSSRAAAHTVAARLADLIDVRDAVDALLAAMGDKQAKSVLRSPSAPLLRYVRGVQEWVLATSDALSALAYDLVKLRADWPALRGALALAKAEWPIEIDAEVRSELDGVESDEVRAALETAFEELSFTLHLLDANLAQRFG